MRPLALLLLALALAGAPPAHAAAARPAHVARAAHAAAKAPGQAAAAAAPNAGGGKRTLEDIHIEGEIPVPQVLFITAREQRRFLEFQHRRYLRSAQSLSAATPIPSRVVVVHPPTPQQESVQ